MDIVEERPGTHAHCGQHLAEPGERRIVRGVRRFQEVPNEKTLRASTTNITPVNVPRMSMPIW